MHRENAGGISADTEQPGMAKSDDTCIAHQQIERQCKQDHHEDLGYQRLVARQHERDKGHRQPGKQLQRLEQSRRHGQAGTLRCGDDCHDAALLRRSMMPFGRQTRTAKTKAKMKIDPASGRK